MFTKSVKCLLVAVAASAGVITVAAAQASAAGGQNHSEPTLRRN